MPRVDGTAPAPCFRRARGAEKNVRLFAAKNGVRRAYRCRNAVVELSFFADRSGRLWPAIEWKIGENSGLIASAP